MECATNCLTLESAALEMDAVAGLNVRVSDPMYHFIISWSEGENPDREEAFAAVQHTLDALGFEGHQFVAAIHRDTDNIHTHVMVNRVHPETGKAHSPSHDHYVMDKAMREMEIRFGRAHANGPYIVVERNGEKAVVRADSVPDRPRPPKKPRRPHEAERMEEYAGEESLFTYVRGEPRSVIAAVLRDNELTWHALHDALAGFGLELKPKGKGLAIYAMGEDTSPIKASSMHEDLSFARLTRRLGAYQASDTTAAMTVELPDLLVFARDRVRPDLTKILKRVDPTWEDLHEALASHGLVLYRKGQGLAVRRTADDASIKASDLHEQLSLVRLVRRLGEFTPPSAEAAARATQRPASAGASERDDRSRAGKGEAGADDKRYHKHADTETVDKSQGGRPRSKAEREARKAHRAQARADLKARYAAYRKSFKRRTIGGDEVRARTKAVNREFAAQRAAVKATPGKANQRRLLYSLITLEAGKARERLMLEIERERAALRRDPQNRTRTYREWVEERAQMGDEAALAQMRGWAHAERRHRKEHEHASRDNTASGTASDDMPDESFVFLNTSAHEVRKDGSVIYWYGSSRAFVDLGRYVRMIPGADNDDARILAALKFSQAKYRGVFRLTGDDEFIRRAVEVIAKYNLDVKLNDALQTRAVSEARQRTRAAPTAKPR